MARLTNNDYLENRWWLTQLWLDSVGSFVELSSREQWHLHAYFRFTEDLSDSSALQHRKAVSRDRPALPQQAGRALRRLRQSAQALAVQPLTASGMRRKKVARVKVRSVVRPQPDVERLAQILLDLTRPPK